jgi:hypothetical protein
MVPSKHVAAVTRESMIINLCLIKLQKLAHNFRNGIPTKTSDAAKVEVDSPNEVVCSWNEEGKLEGVENNALHLNNLVLAECEVGYFAELHHHAARMG